MKMMKKPLLLMMLAAMFMWGCGDGNTEDYGAAKSEIRGRGDVRCMAVPTCPAGSEQVDECPENASCEPVSLCGQTILCAEGRMNCMAVPTCPAGSEQVDECPEN